MKTRHKAGSDGPAEEVVSGEVPEAEARADNPAGEGEALSLREHLMELRKSIIVCLAAVGIAFVGTFYFLIDPLMSWITAPIEARGVQVIYTAVSEALTTKLKVAIVTAVVIAFPVIIWQI